MFEPGSLVTLLPYRRPEFRVGTIEQRIHTKNGVYYCVRRQDGQLVHMDGDELETRT